MLCPGQLNVHDGVGATVPQPLDGGTRVLRWDAGESVLVAVGDQERGTVRVRVVHRGRGTRLSSAVHGTVVAV